MTDDRTPPETPEDDHDYHSQLEVDDTSGWRVFIVPGALILFVIVALLFIFLYPDDEPDPRIANRFQGQATEETAVEQEPTIDVQVEDHRGQPGVGNMADPMMQDPAMQDPGVQDPGVQDPLAPPQGQQPPQ